VVYHGSLEDRAFLRQEFFSPAGLQKMEVVITTYHGATRNIIDKAAFKRLKFDFAIYDEAHLLKNMTSQKYRSLMSTIHASGRLLLTGTPVSAKSDGLIFLTLK
jgi:SWI/SNF-related matrix-associated actin-dependent regulator of chromatin subfamily A containing DEAD/H box 1